MLHKAVLPGLYVLGPAQPGAAGEHGSMSVVPAPAPAAAAAAAAAAALAAAAAAAVAAPPASPTRRRDLPKTEPPPGAVFDDTVTTFKGYYMESVANSALETWRVRKLIIRFYLRDSKVEVDEEQDELTRNDGMLHGKFLKRSSLPGLDRTSYTSMLRVGGELELQGRHVRLYECDESTRAHFASKCITQPANSVPPTDAYTEAALKAQKPADGWYGTRTSSITRFLEASMGSQRDFNTDAKGRAGKLDGAKLLFELEWLDAEAGDSSAAERKPTKYWMQYYQASREVEISEAPGQRAHRASLRFLQRGRLPRTVLAHDDRARSCDVLDIERDYYSEADFLVGATIHVFGREMTVTDVDDTTQAYYLAEHGIDQRSRRRAPPPQPPPRAPVARAPSSLVPKAPRKDTAARDGYFCRWQATLDTTKAAGSGGGGDATGGGGGGGKGGSGGSSKRGGDDEAPTADDFNALRKFTVCFYGDERAVTIYEQRQAGVTGGIFLKRCAGINPATSEPFRREDFATGRVLTINSFRFRIGNLDKEGHTGVDAAPGASATAEAAAAAAAASILSEHDHRHTQRA